MNIENIIEMLLTRFPELRVNYEDERDHIDDLPYCVFDMIFVKYIIEVCQKSNVEKMKEISVFLEEMAQCSDEQIDNLFGVSIIEPLIYELETLKVLRKYLKEKTLHALELMENWRLDAEISSQELFDAFNKNKK